MIFLKSALTAMFFVSTTMVTMLESAHAANINDALTKPKSYIGSKTCKTCHLQHYDAWRRTMHSKMLQNISVNADVMVTDIIEDKVRADLAKKEATLKVPSSEIFVPNIKDIKFTIGSQWKQRYLIEKDGKLFIAPTQFNIDTGTWTNYHEHDWNKRPWLKKCGGCHATGVNLEKNTFNEPGVGCEACHGPGSHHAALPSSKTYKKRQTILNPAKLTGGIATQICGQCHNRGKSTLVKGSNWAVGYTPGKALETYFKSIEPGDKYLYPNGYSKGHHQQYIDWKKSKHADSGIDCITCHTVHELGNPTFTGKTKKQGDTLCLACHVLGKPTGAHAVHTFGNCSNCHMPRIAKSAESGDIRSHIFDVILPLEARDAGMPSSCQTCHQHKNEDPADLQRRWDNLTAPSKTTAN